MRSRIYGLGSVFGKTMRDSRRSLLIGGGLLAGLTLYLCVALPLAFSTQASRDEIVRMASSLGSVGQGLAGKAVNVGTLGGYMQWKYGPFFLWIAALWSILALSATLAGEARQGNLEFVAASPIRRRVLALEKLAAHVTVLAIALAIMAVVATVASAAFGKLPGDSISLVATIGLAVWLGLMALAFGGLAFALAPFLGRSAAAGIAGFVLFAGWILNGYQADLGSLGWLANITPVGWTANHLPLAGEYDWASLVPVAVAAVVLLAAGVEAFARRDLGASTSARLPGLPAVTLGIEGPVRRGFGDRLPAALAWGIGMAAFGFFMAAISRSMADQVESLPDFHRTLDSVFPTIDITTPGGFLELLILTGYLGTGLAAAVFVSGWGSDETTGRLEMLLSTPLSRPGWAIFAGLGVYLGIAVMTVIAAAGVAIGSLVAGGDALTPFAGTLVLGAFALAVAGIGMAVGGLVRTSIAAEVVAAVVAAMFAIDLLAPALNAPDWVRQLTLGSHLGEPMVGRWDPAGIVLCAGFAVLGLAVGAWGMRRRDVTR